jgi:hypothetical protein
MIRQATTSAMKNRYYFDNIYDLWQVRENTPLYFSAHSVEVCIYHELINGTAIIISPDYIRA